MIWCVDDDDTIREIEVYALTQTGFEAKGFADGVSMLKALKTEIPELIVLDIMLPGKDGVEVLKEIKSNPDTRKIPVIMATAKGTEMDKIQGLDTGADDYLVKPVSMEVLVAKAQAMLRRTYDYRTPLLPTVQGARYDSAALYIEKDGVRVKLTPNEGKLLSCLISKRGKVVSREELMISLWDSDQFVDDNTLSVNMNRLRRKFEEVGVKNCIVTHRARGYALDG